MRPSLAGAAPRRSTRRRYGPRHDASSGSTPACSTSTPTSCAPRGGGSRTSASAGSRSGTTSTAPPASPTTRVPRGGRACTPRWPATPRACACGSLVYSIGYRHPAVLAKAITAIDHLSGGRADMGIGAGWAEVEYDAYGIPFPSVRDPHGPARGGHPVPARPAPRRASPPSTGELVHAHEARNEPRPVQAKLPIWIGGGGEKRTLRIAARYADGWNVPFVAPATFAHKRAVLAPATARTSAATRPRSAARSTSGWPGPRRACAASSARSPTSCARRAHRLRRRGARPHRRSTSTPAPTRSTSPCGRRSTSTRSTASARRCTWRDRDVSDRVRSSCARAGQPDRRPHRLHRWARAADGDRPVDGASAAWQRGDRDRARPRTTSPMPVDLPLAVGDPRPSSRRGAATSPASWPRWRAPATASTGTVTTDDPHRCRPVVAAPRSRWPSASRSGSTADAVELARAVPARRAPGERRAVRDHGPARASRPASPATRC